MGMERHDRSATSSFLSVGSADSQHAANFDHDASASIYDSLVEGHESANIQLELTALRMSTNASDHQVRRAVVSSFVKRVTQLTKSGEAIKSAVAQVFGQHKELIDRSIFDKNAESKTDQIDFMLLLQADLCNEKSTENADMEKVRQKTKSLIDFLQMESEDESEEESDED